jgi:hypothetical protein
LLRINIQSFSDVITNSSSEIFCTISGDDLVGIYELLEPLLPGYDSPTEFYKAGLEAILDKYFKDNYTIEYE